MLELYCDDLTDLLAEHKKGDKLVRLQDMRLPLPRCTALQQGWGWLCGHALPGLPQPEQTAACWHQA